MMAARSKYNQLVQLLKKAQQLKGIESVLSWDQLVMMPQKGAEARGEQLATLAGIIYDQETLPQIGQLLNEISQETALDFNEYESALLKLAKKAYDRKVKIPKDLVEQSAKLSADGYEIWVEARKTNNFSLFAPVLKQWIELRKKAAEAIDPSTNCYDVFLDEYETGLTQDRVDQVFGEVKKFLIPFIQQILKAKQEGKQVKYDYLTSETVKFDLKVQESVNRDIAEQIGYDFSSGRIDVSVHPFSIGIARGDVRITTRYQDSEFLQGIAGTMHEAGHGMYEQNLNKEYYGTPVAAPLGMGVHESQSLFWERHVGLSKQFWQNYLPLIKEKFPQLPDVTVDEFYRAANVVEPIFIRVESDEVTYPLHIVLRYEIERGLFDGSIQVDDLPTVWNNKFEEYLGVKPPTDTKGVLQDVHWGSGYFGYFPTYLLGAMYAAQLAAKIPDFEQNVTEKKFVDIRNQLTERVHARGSVDMSVDKLLTVATGEPLNSKYFIEYLRNKYSDIYQLN